MATVEVLADHVEIRLSLAEEVLAVHGSLHVPLQHIASVSSDPVPPALWRGVRVGANLPGILVAGTFFTTDGAVFYDIRQGDRCLTLELRSERYRRVVVEVGPDQDPAQLAAEISSRLPAG